MDFQSYSKGLNEEDMRELNEVRKRAGDFVDSLIRVLGVSRYAAVSFFKIFLKNKYEKSSPDLKIESQSGSEIESDGDSDMVEGFDMEEKILEFKKNTLPLEGKKKKKDGRD